MKRTKAIRHFARQAAMTLLIAFLAVTTTHAEDISPWEGAGTQENPYVITNTAGLNLLASKVNSGMDFWMTYFVLDADITYSYNTDWDDEESNFTPIDNIFNGTFDGQGHTISGIRIYSEEDCQGLFGGVNGTVRNVILADVRIQGENSVGGIAGKNNGTIENCHVCADVFIASAGNDPENHGGIVGENYGTVNGCTSAATVSGRLNCGGIVGQNYGTGTVNGCTSEATVSGSQNCGGIVGENYVTVSNCRAVGVKVSGDTNLGAIVGVNQEGTLSHNYYCRCTCNWDTDNIGTGNDDISDNDGAVPTEGIALLDGASNESLIAYYSSRVDDWYDYTLFGRTLYKNGSWNTICLPFNVDLDYYSNSYSLLGDGLTVMALDAANCKFANGTLTLNFTTIYDGTHKGNLVAGTPYIIKWDEDTDNSTIVNPTFEGVKITTDMNPATTEYVDFIGTTSPVSFTQEDKSVLFLGSGNNLYYPQPQLADPEAEYDADDNPYVPVTIGSFRGYFKLKNGLTAGEPTAPNSVRSFVLNFGDESNAICTLTTDPSAKDKRGWYDLQGRQLQDKPTAKGLYIRDGRVVVN